MTRFYLPSTGTPSVSPAYNAAWADTTFAARLSAVTTKISSAMASASITGDANKLDRAYLIRQYVSDRLGAQTIAAQALKFQIRASETDTENNLFVTISIRSWNGSTFQELLALTLDGTELTTSLVNRQFTATTTARTVAEGDRLVIEIGVSGDPAQSGADAHNSSIRIGDAAASDLPENDTDTNDYNPWVEFANTLNFIVTTNSDRAAKTAGKVATNDERATKISGKATSNAERSVKTAGKQSTTAERNAKTSGVVITNDQRSAKLTGTASASTSSERNATLSGVATATSERSTKTTGKSSANDERSGLLSGKALGTDTRNAKATGVDTANSIRDAKTTGKDSATAEREATLLGGIIQNSERSLKIYAGYENTFADDFETTDHKDVGATTALWVGDGKVTLGI